MQVMQPLDQNSIRIERFLNGNSYQIILLKNAVIVVRIINRLTNRMLFLRMSGLRNRRLVH